MEKRISELNQALELKDGCCFPVVQDGETKKVSFETVQKELGIEDLQSQIDSKYKVVCRRYGIYIPAVYIIEADASTGIFEFKHTYLNNGKCEIVKGYCDLDNRQIILEQTDSSTTVSFRTDINGIVVSRGYVKDAIKIIEAKSVSVGIKNIYAI